jgi:hypothetical protein
MVVSCHLDGSGSEVVTGDLVWTHGPFISLMFGVTLPFSEFWLDELPVDAGDRG